MRGGLRDRRWRILAFAGGAVYALFLIAAPFEHHDIVCHLKTPQHCSSCTSSLVGSHPQTPATLGGWHLTDAGRTVGFELLADGTLLPARSTGRSPPAQV